MLHFYVSVDLQQVLSVCDSPELSSPLVLCANLSIAVEARCTEIEGTPKKMREGWIISACHIQKSLIGTRIGVFKYAKVSSKEEKNLLFLSTSQEFRH